MDKIQIIEKLFKFIVVYSYLLFPLFLLFNKTKKREILSIVIYGIAIFLLLYFFHDIPKSLKKYYQSFYTFLEYSFFAYFLWLNIKNKRFKQIIILLSIAFVVFQIVYLLTVKFTWLDTVAVGIESILIFIYIFYFFYEYFTATRNQFIYHNYTFWLSVGLLVYLGGSFFINILINDLDVSQKESYWYLTFIAETIKNIFFVIAIFVFVRKPNVNTPQQSPSVPYLDLI